jgi:hypothetical protein
MTMEIELAHQYQFTGTWRKYGWKKHHDPLLWKCTLCNLETPDTAEMKTHIEDAHLASPVFVGASTMWCPAGCVPAEELVS